jgi:hypothetical protein
MLSEGVGYNMGGRDRESVTKGKEKEITQRGTRTETVCAFVRGRHIMGKWKDTRWGSGRKHDGDVEGHTMGKRENTHTI